MQEIAIIGTVAGVPSGSVHEGRRFIRFTVSAENSGGSASRFTVVTSRTSLLPLIVDGAAVFVSGHLNLLSGSISEAVIQALVIEPLEKEAGNARSQTPEPLFGPIPLQSV